MKVYQSTAIIDAPPETIWALLTDGPNYPTWNPTVDRIEGRIALGETIKLHVKINPGRAFPVKVTEFVPPSRMVFSGGMPAGLFKGVRTFTMSPEGQSTRFLMREEYTGPLLPLIWRTIPDMGPAFEEYAQSLKSAAEARARRG